MMDRSARRRAGMYRHRAAMQLVRVSSLLCVAPGSQRGTPTAITHGLRPRFRSLVHDAASIERKAHPKLWDRGRKATAGHRSTPAKDVVTRRRS